MAHHDATDDPTVALGLDAIETAVVVEDMNPVLAKNCRRMKNKYRAAWAQMPKSMQINVPLGDGKIWRPYVLVTADSSQAVGMECTTDVFCHLWHLVLAQISQADKVAPLIAVSWQGPRDSLRHKMVVVAGMCVPEHGWDQRLVNGIRGIRYHMNNSAWFSTFYCVNRHLETVR